MCHEQGDDQDDCLLLAIGQCIGDHLSLSSRQRVSQKGQPRCFLYATGFTTRDAILTDRVLGKSELQRWSPCTKTRFPCCTGRRHARNGVTIQWTTCCFRLGGGGGGVGQGSVRGAVHPPPSPPRPKWPQWETTKFTIGKIWWGQIFGSKIPPSPTSPPPLLILP